MSAPSDSPGMFPDIHPPSRNSGPAASESTASTTTLPPVGNSDVKSGADIGVLDMSLLDEDPELMSQPTFTKTLNSELSNEEAYALLCRIKKQKAWLFYRFRTAEDLREAEEEGEDDIGVLAESLSVVKMKRGERLIAKGEQATFFGIILKGEFDAVVSKSLSFPLKAGDLLGEMAYFEEGPRSADVVTSSEQAVVGVILYEELEQLLETRPELHDKVQHMLGLASIKKLRNQVAGAEQKKQELASEVKEREAEAQGLARQQRKQAEVLYRMKLSTTSQSNKEADDLAHELQKQEKQRKRAEHRRRGAQTKIKALQFKIQKLVDAYKETGDKLQKSERYLRMAKKDASRKEELLTEQMKELTALKAKNSSLAGQVHARERQCDSLKVELQIKVSQLEQQRIAEVEALKSKLRSAQGATVEALRSSQKQVDTLQSQASLASHELGEQNRRYAELQNDYDALKSAQEKYSANIQQYLATMREQEEVMKELRSKYRNAEEKVIESMVWKQRSREFEKKWRTAVDGNSRKLHAMGEESSRMRADLESYKLILRQVLVSNFVRTYKAKRALVTCYRLLADVLILIVTEQCKNQTHGGVNTISSADLEASILGDFNIDGLRRAPDRTSRKKRGKRTAKSSKKKAGGGGATRGTGSGASGPSGGGGGGDGSSKYSINGDAETKEESLMLSPGQGELSMTLTHGNVTGAGNLARRMRVELRKRVQQLSQPRRKLRTLVHVLKDQCARLEKPFLGVAQEIAHWRATSGSFFQRSIDLHAQVKSWQERYQQSMAQVQTLQTLLKQRNTEFQQLCEKFTASEERCKALRTDLMKLERSFKKRKVTKQIVQRRKQVQDLTEQALQLKQVIENLQYKHELLLNNPPALSVTGEGDGDSNSVYGVRSPGADLLSDILASTNSSGALGVEAGGNQTFITRAASSSSSAGGGPHISIYASADHKQSTEESNAQSTSPHNSSNNVRKAAVEKRNQRVPLTSERPIVLFPKPAR